MATRIVRRNWLVAWRAWRSSIFLSILSPVMFLSAMGLGLGSMVQEQDAFAGADYFAFFATGMLAASCMQTGVFSATYPILSKIMWQRTYEAVLSSPLTVRDIFIGEVLTFGAILAQLAIPFFGIMSLFGIFDSPLSLLAIPSAMLVGLACAAVTFAFTATRKTDEAYTWVFRFIVTPLFLLSGTFFPISELPGWGQVIAHATPLFHGVELVRQFTLYEVEPSALWHVGYLVTMLAVGGALAVRNLEKRLLP
ncbi:MAG TPA: ABC transporter permease [Actinomycetota bacterium]|nr:ABC transporter permease [Actinomycetota bacterium]